MTRRFADLARRLLPVLALAALLAATPTSAQDDLPTAREVLDRFVEVVGGEKLAEMESMTTRGTFAIPAQGMQGAMVARAKAPDQMMVEIEIPGYGTVRQGYLDGVAWAIDPATGAQVMTGKALAQTADQADFDAMLYKDEDYESLTMVGAADFQGTPAYQIEVVSDDGITAQHFFSQETGLLVGMESEQHTPMGAIPTTSAIKEYQEFDGIRIATKTEQSMMGMQQVMTFESVNFEPIDDAVFALPAEIQALTDDTAGSADGTGGE